MGFTDKMRNKLKMGKGGARKGIGRVRGNSRPKAKGRGERWSGAARQAGERIKGTIRKPVKK